MESQTLVEARVDAEVKDRATAVLETLGLSLSDAFGFFLARTARDGALPFAIDDPEHDAWFRARVEEALNDPRPALGHDEVEALFARRRAVARDRASRDGA